MATEKVYVLGVDVPFSLAKDGASHHPEGVFRIFLIGQWLPWFPQLLWNPGCRGDFWRNVLLPELKHN